MACLGEDAPEGDENLEQAAIREIAEETGLEAEIITNLGDIHYEFSAGNKLISKTVHHFLMRQVGGDLTVDNDPQHEAVDVQWFEIENLDSTLAHENERRMGRGVQEWLARQ